MTTAARPTFHPAKGGNTARDRNAPTQIRSAKELTAHLSLKARKPGQNPPQEVAKLDLKAILLSAEAAHRKSVPVEIKVEDPDLNLENDLSSDDDTDELLAELAKIKEERMAEPSTLLKTDFTVKRRWDEDVVFRDQAKLESKVPKRFINDMLRSDFHRKFLFKYVH